jgi:hypothetical protein
LATWNSHGRERRAQAEAGQVLVDAQQHVLAEVLGQRAVAVDDAQDVGEERRLILLDEQREGAFVTRLRAS